MTGVDIGVDGKAGHVTLNRPRALNALSYDMCVAIDAALEGWRRDDSVALVLIDAEGERALCAGGDLAEMHATGIAGTLEYGRRFWRDEYRLNAKIAEYPKPVVSLMQGYTMGGGVELGCHASHHVLCESSRLAMPECGLGPVPDVGGSLLLARAPGRLGEYLALTAARMGPADALRAGFADHFVPAHDWPETVAVLAAGWGIAILPSVATAPPRDALAALQDDIDSHFARETLGDIVRSLTHAQTGFAHDALKQIGRASPLSIAVSVRIIHRLCGSKTLRDALALEFRFTWRAMERSDFLEGIRAAIIDKNHKPAWRHRDARSVPAADVAEMLMPLGADSLTFEETET